MLPEEDRVTATGVLHKNLVKISPAVPEIYSQTDRQTSWLQYSAPLPRQSKYKGQRQQFCKWHKGKRETWRQIAVNTFPLTTMALTDNRYELTVWMWRINWLKMPSICPTARLFSSSERLSTLRCWRPRPRRIACHSHSHHIRSTVTHA